MRITYGNLVRVTLVTGDMQAASVEGGFPKIPRRVAAQQTTRRLEPEHVGIRVKNALGVEDRLWIGRCLGMTLGTSPTSACRVMEQLQALRCGGAE